MLCSGGNHCHAHLHRPKEVGDSRETVCPEPLDVFQGLIDGVYAFVPRRVSALSMSHAVQDHKALLSHGHIHSSRLPYHSEINLPYLRKEKVETALPADFFLCGSRKHQPVGLRGRNQF